MLFNNLISTDRCRSSGESDTRAEVFWRVKPTLLLKASCRWSGAAAIIPTKTVSAGSARVRVCRVANAFIRDAAGLAYIDDQGRLFPLLEVDEDDEEPVLFESEQDLVQQKARTSSLPKCGCCRCRCWRVCPSSVNRSGSAVRWFATNTIAAVTWSASSAATATSNAASAIKTI